MNKVVVTIVAIGLIFGAGFGVAWWYWGRDQQAPTPAPLDKGEIVDELRAEADFVVSSQRIQLEFELPNEVRLQMEDVAKSKNFIDAFNGSLKALESFFFGDYIQMRAVGEVLLAVNFMQFSTEDVVQNGDVITITTPPVRVYKVIVDLEESIPIERERGIWLKLMDNDDLRNQAQALISQQIIEKVCEGDLMAEGQEKARNEITKLLQKVVGGKTIEVKVDVGACALPQE